VTKKPTTGAPDREAGPGPLTSLVNEVFRGSSEGGPSGWVSGLAPGSVLGRYDLIRELGRGGSGVVWEARDRELGRRVAVKVMRTAGPGAPEKRLLAEAEVAARLSHPGIVTILDVGRNERGTWLVQEFLSGETLGARLEAGPIPLREALRIAVEVARALAYAHTHGVVHRDLTPRNVFLCADGQVKLLDLGMAQAFGRRKLDGGSPDFMAPEQVRGEPEDERTDVFALGALLYRMLTGRSPFPDGDGSSGLARGIEVSEAPALGALIEGMLASAPAERPRDAAEVLDAIVGIAAGLPPGGDVVRARVRVRAPPRLRWIAAGALAGVAVATLAALGFALVRSTQPAPPPADATVAASSATTPCTWRLLSVHDLRGPAPGAVARQGSSGSQGVADAGGSKAWTQRSDWNQLFVPIGTTVPDFFGAEASFLAVPVPGRARGVKMMVLTDPSGPDGSDVKHGRGVFLIQEPGRAPTFEWGVLDGMNARKVVYKGTLGAPFTGKWRTLRLEGSRSRCWVRLLLDGVPLLTEVGSCDLAGTHVMLGAATDAYQPADVAWSNLRIFEGEPDCQ
jgi:hypothetical protein